MRNPARERSRNLNREVWESPSVLRRRGCQISVDWQLTLSFAFAAALGTFIGAYLGQFVSAKQLQKGFGYFLLAIATLVLIQNRHILHNFLTPKGNSLILAEKVRFIQPTQLKTDH
mgnify:CR=1 FL=1